jgi:hypothetical protein
MIEPMGTHPPPLLAAITATPGLPVLEIVAGHYSTPNIHAAAVPAGRKVTTIETGAEWMANFTYLAGPLHEFLPQTDELIDELAKQRWGVVFVGDMGGHLRIKRLASFFDTADFIVMHDYDYPATKASLDGWLEKVSHQAAVYTTYHPHTLVVSKNRNIADLAL